MDTPDDQLKTLKMRVRNLERSLSESEALSLEQIECTHRLEQQLVEARSLVEEKEQTLARLRQEIQSLEQRPSEEAYRLQEQHIQELQQIIWDLEKRPTHEHYRILQQQLSTSQAEIDMLKMELERRIDPNKFFQLQHELSELKDYANQLGEFAARLPQVQLQHAQAQKHSHELQSELNTLREKVGELQQRPSLHEVQAREEELRQAQQRLQEQLDAARRELEKVTSQQQSDQAWQQKISAIRAERDALIRELALRSSHSSPGESPEIATLKHHLAQVKQELAERPDPETVEHLQTQLEHLQANLATSQVEQRSTLSQLNALQNELAAVKMEREQLRQQTAASLQEDGAQVAQLEQELANARSQLAELQNRPTQVEADQWRQQLELFQARWTQSEKLAEQLQQEVVALRSQLAESRKDEDRFSESLLQDLRTEMTELQEQLKDLQVERERLARELENRPQPTALQEAQRRQELAEAHHLVSKRQIEKLQRQVEELKAECVQAHAYAQTQEKEVAFLEGIKEDLESRLASLALSGQPSSSVKAELPATRWLGTERPSVANSVVAARIQPSEPNTVPYPEPVSPPAASAASGTPGIPPLTLNSEEQASTLLRHHLAGSPRSSRRKTIELPAFVQRR